jgi:acyl-CoA dehydrogenase
VAKYLLEFERGGAIAAARLRAALERTVGLAERRGLLDDPDLALAISAVEVDVDALEATELRVMATMHVGQNPGGLVSSMLKLRWSEIQQAIAALGVRVLGADALAWELERPMPEATPASGLGDDARPLVAQYLNARAYTIFGGSSEVQREILAREVLG